MAIQARVVRLSRGSRRSAASRTRRVRRALQEGQRVEAALVRRQAARRAVARDQTRDDTRSATLIAGGAGLLALLGAVGLVLSLAGTIRRPLDELVEATRKLAAGDLDQRVEPGGPREIQELDASFNEMAERLQEAQVRLEAERANLALTIESLGDALVVTDREGTVTAANPRAAELVPTPGRRHRRLRAPTARCPTRIAAWPGTWPSRPAGARWRPPPAACPARARARAWCGPSATSPSGRGWSAIKSDFVATASHELRSPLTSIKGFVELLGRSDALGDREREFVDVVLQSTDRLVDLVNDLLDVARLEAGRMEIHARLFDVATVIEEVATLMGPRMEEKDQRLVLDLPPGLPKVLADPVRVRQILTNLISNAHLYTDEGGVVTVIADGDGQEVELSVADDGRGMTQEDLDQVFDRFVRRDDDAGGGTGLGLSIVRSLVDLQGGTVDVRSHVGEGTVFSVRLPAEGTGSEASRRAVGGRSVLVVTSRPDTRAAELARVAGGGRRRGVGARDDGAGRRRPAPAALRRPAAGRGGPRRGRAAAAGRPARRPRSGPPAAGGGLCREPGQHAGRRVARPGRRRHGGADRDARRRHRGGALQHPGGGPVGGAGPGRGRAAGHRPGPPVGHHRHRRRAGVPRGAVRGGSGGRRDARRRRRARLAGPARRA